MTYIPGIAGGITSQNQQSSAQRKFSYQNQTGTHKSGSQVSSMGLLDQLLMNLKAINIDKLDEKEQDQLRCLSNQYQFHLNQFQDYQKQQILNGNFDSAIGLGPPGNAPTNSLNQ